MINLNTTPSPYPYMNLSPFVHISSVDVAALDPEMLVIIHLHRNATGFYYQGREISMFTPEFYSIYRFLPLFCHCDCGSVGGT